MTEVLAEKIVSEKILAKGTLRYSLIETEEFIEGESVLTYGVAITSTVFKTAEECRVLSISENRDEIEEFMKILVENAVIPSFLEELVTDFIGD